MPRLEENIVANDVELTASDLRDIDATAAHVSVQGERYGPAHPAMIDR